MTLPLFDDEPRHEHLRMGAQAWLLRGHALAQADALLAALDAVLAAAPPSGMVTPGGRPMSVQTTSCGTLGWVSGPQGYGYAAHSPHTGQPWPAMPDIFRHIAQDAATCAGFPGFAPDSCLINRYQPGARMSLHQDRDERDMSAPIVSVSLGMPAVFLFGGQARSDPAERWPLFHGDIVVWGGVDRLRFHGVLPVPDEPHSPLGAQRINLTFRRSGWPG